MKSDALAQRINEIFNEDLEIEEIYQVLEALNRELEKGLENVQKDRKQD